MSPRSSWLLLAACLLLPFVPARAQSFEIGGWSIDPGALVAGGQDLLRRSPDAEVDGLFQAVHTAARHPQESAALCALFEPEADRSLPGLQAAIARFGPDSRNRFADALAGLLVAASQNPPQPYDDAAARQLLKATGVRAALVNDGFVAGLSAAGNDAAGQQARCRSLRWLLDAAGQQPLADRAALTRLLLHEGLQRLPQATASGGR